MTISCMIRKSSTQGRRNSKQSKNSHKNGSNDDESHDDSGDEPDVNAQLKFWSFNYKVSSDFVKYSSDLGSDPRGNYFQRCIEQARSGLAFNLTIPDPEEHIDNQLTEVGKKEHEVSVILLYFPFESGAESKPPFHIRNSVEDSNHTADNEHHGSQQNRSSSSSSQMASRTLSSSSSSSSSVPIIIDDEPQDDIFNVFWLNRLVPETTLKELPFFPGSSAKDISEKWKHRLKGFIFLNRTFEKISNNKLRITLDFDEWLNDKKVWKQVRTPKNLKDTFLE